jgi:peroxiredoxin
MFAKWSLGLMLALLPSLAWGQKLDKVEGSPPTLPEKLPWWGPKKENNQKTWSDLKGKVVLVHFFTALDSWGEGNLHYFISWKESYTKNGLEVIGFHTQPMDQEWEPKRIADRVDQFSKYAYSILDRSGDSLHEWKVEAVPTLYLIDRKGKMRYRFEGQITWKRTDHSREVKSKLIELLEEKP